MIDWREIAAAAAIIVLLLGAMALITGCTTPFHAICGVQSIGQSEAGVPYFAIACEPQK